VTPLASIPISHFVEGKRSKLPSKGYEFAVDVVVVVTGADAWMC
jgi:hypothetical protein